MSKDLAPSGKLRIGLNYSNFLLVIGDDAKDIDIISNSVDVKPDGTWSIRYRHPSRYA